MKYTIDLSSNRQYCNKGLLIKDVKILAEGVWNGRNYTASELQKAVDNWRDNSLFDRHFENEQRDETNRVGYVTNQHFADNAIMGDVFISNETGQHMIDQIDNVNGISVEHLSSTFEGDEVDICFLGAAIVPTPACEICNLSKENTTMDTEERAEFDELNSKVSELAKTIEELTKTDVDAVVKEQSKKDSLVIANLEKRIKELEDTPVQATQNVESVDDSYANFVVERGEVSRRL